jgi:hypothetical protein
MILNVSALLVMPNRYKKSRDTNDFIIIITSSNLADGKMICHNSTTSTNKQHSFLPFYHDTLLPSPSHYTTGTMPMPTTGL